MTDKQREYLTKEILHECWHEFEGREGFDRCKKCGTRENKYFTFSRNPTFTTPDDFFAVVRSMRPVDLLVIWSNMGNDATVLQEPDFIEKFMLEVCK